jgi:hypothetical protein
MAGWIVQLHRCRRPAGAVVGLVDGPGVSLRSTPGYLPTPRPGARHVVGSRVLQGRDVLVGLRSKISLEEFLGKGPLAGRLDEPLA